MTRGAPKVLGKIFGGARAIYDKDVGKELASGRGNNKATTHPYSGRREAERAAKRRARKAAP